MSDSVRSEGGVEMLKRIPGRLVDGYEDCESLYLNPGYVKSVFGGSESCVMFLHGCTAGMDISESVDLVALFLGSEESDWEVFYGVQETGKLAEAKTWM